MTSDESSAAEQCYVGDCPETFRDLEAVEEHIRATDDYAHTVTAAFLPTDLSE